ncbi:MAG: ComEC/Rec2 family competence protein [Candidatus Omnitrophica bacterium]|nr:ComEC/Rec2 family competence protein [Candidatus Omnitrophota bacterium]
MSIRLIREKTGVDCRQIAQRYGIGNERSISEYCRRIRQKADKDKKFLKKYRLLESSLQVEVTPLFNIFTPVSVLANLIIIPLLFLIILSALLFIFLGMLIPALAPILALNCEFFVVIMYKINSILIAIPWAYIMLSRIALWQVMLYYAILLIFCVRSRIKAAVHTLRG